MNTTMLLRSLVIVLAAWLWAGVAPIAAAHTGPSRVELGAAQVSPGATLEVRGINIAPEQRVTLDLVGPETDLPLGVAMGDTHGDFTQEFLLPATLSPGAYSIRAVGENHVIVGVSLTVISPGVADDTEQGAQPDGAQPPLGPLPQDDSAPVGQPQPEPPASNSLAGVAAAGGASTLLDSSMQMAIGAVLLMLLVVGLAFIIWRRVANAG